MRNEAGMLWLVFILFAVFGMLLFSNREEKTASAETPVQEVGDYRKYFQPPPIDVVSEENACRVLVNGVVAFSDEAKSWYIKEYDDFGKLYFLVFLGNTAPDKRMKFAGKLKLRAPAPVANQRIIYPAQVLEVQELKLAE